MVIEIIERYIPVIRQNRKHGKIKCVYWEGQYHSQHGLITVEPEHVVATK